MLKTIITATIAASATFCTAQTAPDQTVCLGANHEYGIENPVEGSVYHWIVNGGSNISDTAPTISITWEKEGDYQLSVYETNEAGCDGPQSSITISVVSAPKAEFDNAQLCYGEQLSIELSGSAPFSVEYTLDGQRKTISDISTTTYKLPKNVAGKYALTKVSDKYCNSVPETNSKAIIGNIMKPLTIKH